MKLFTPLQILQFRHLSLKILKIFIRVGLKLFPPLKNTHQVTVYYIIFETYREKFWLGFAIALKILLAISFFFFLLFLQSYNFQFDLILEILPNVGDSVGFFERRQHFVSTMLQDSFIRDSETLIKAMQFSKCSILLGARWCSQSFRYSGVPRWNRVFHFNAIPCDSPALCSPQFIWLS